ncbi:isoamylase early set domain-containing protein [Oscillochloris sp. ZM17-4]|uniref:isoamylase early set domain-containing protein n=1 Tax=Oscillochloris sp. ZM17-4 TaxID=2866714 RepID=UPI001C7389D1|nr:isoamylase early set domain-containing protein [Oscillochloris sp. ZM17-4]MBX0327824.1 isoamylase early set domain-containing protein [Oscillochloris sp. ZM17-4]
MITKMPGRPGKVRVTFALPSAIWADTIFLVGDFNNWDERATPMRQTEMGWMVTLELDAGASFQYRYLHNTNEWHNDWNADGYALNAFGGDNSVVITPDFELAEREIGAPEPERVISFSQPRLRLVTAS